MINIKSLFIFMAVLVVLALGFLLFPAVQAQAGIPCLLDITKETIPGDDVTEFNFTCTGGQNPGCSDFSLMDGDTESNIMINHVIPQQMMATVVELVPQGWGLDDISCEITNGNTFIDFDFNSVENGVIVTCTGNTNATCTFRNIKQCSITIEKIALADDGTLFDFTAPGSSDPDFALGNNDDIELLIDNGLSVDVTEIVPDEWRLDQIDCSVPVGVLITDIPNGRNFTCNSPGGTADCVFINSPLRNIPTLSEWGLIALAALLGIVGFMVIRRRKLAA